MSKGGGKKTLGTFSFCWRKCRQELCCHPALLPQCPSADEDEEEEDNWKSPPQFCCAFSSGSGDEQTTMALRGTVCRLEEGREILFYNKERDCVKMGNFLVRTSPGEKRNNNNNNTKKMLVPSCLFASRDSSRDGWQEPSFISLPFPPSTIFYFCCWKRFPCFSPSPYECCCIFPTPFESFFCLLFFSKRHPSAPVSITKPNHVVYYSPSTQSTYKQSMENSTTIKQNSKIFYLYFFLPREKDVEIPLLLLLLLFPIGTPTWSLDGSYRNSAENRVLPLSIGLSFLFVDSTKSNLFVFWL